jgi:hypothetical protein
MAEEPVDSKPTFKGGPYFAAAVGYGAPLGAQVVLGDGASIGGGVGVIGSLGYQITQNFGIGAFIHYNDVAVEYVDEDSRPDDSSASVLFYGLEARAGFITDAVDGWASLGLALGTGSLNIKNEDQSCGVPGSGCITFRTDATGDVTFGPMPSIGFGAAAKLSRQWGLGPVLRLYVLSVGEACEDGEREVSSSVPGISSETTEFDDCTKDTDEVIVPNVAFAGLELTFRP